MPRIPPPSQSYNMPYLDYDSGPNFKRMGYLRGSRAPARKYAPPTLRNEVARLKRQVAKNKPAPNFFTRTTNLTDAGTGYQHSTINVTETFTGDSSYRNYITGDKFYNAWIKCIYTADDPVIEQLRIVIYMPKVADSSFQPQKTKEGFATIPDPAAFRVYMDKVIMNPNSLQPIHFNWLTSLRGAITEYNGSSSTMERGNLRILVFWENGTTDTGGTLGWQYCTVDK